MKPCAHVLVILLVVVCAPMFAAEPAAKPRFKLVAPHPFWMSQPWLDQTADVAAEFFGKYLMR
jgi:hypothetical protein